MPSKIMDQQGLPSSSYFSEEVCFPSERQVGFWKREMSIDHFGSKSVTSSPLEKFIPVESQPGKFLERVRPFLHRDQKINISPGIHGVGNGGAAGYSSTLWGSLDQDIGGRSNLNVQSASCFIEGEKINMTGARYENSLFSSSLSELFTRKLKLASDNGSLGHSVDTVTHYEEDEPFESLEEIEAQTIGNLLPDDDDLLSGVTDGLDYIIEPGSGDDIEELDLFSSVGGMDLGDDSSYTGQKNADVSGGMPNGQVGGSSGSIAGEHPFGEHPSRTLFVRNINSNVEDSELRALFEQYGDIRTLYTACKHRGFVMISYYDLRAARNAMRALQNKPLRRRKLDIHFSIPKDNPSEKDINQGTLVVFNLDSSISNDELHQIFGVYGEIKEIRETPHRSHHKFIEYYDVRAAEAALRALNRSDIAGKRIKLEHSRPGVARRLMQQFPTELDPDESGPYLQQSSSPINSTTGFAGPVSRSALASSGMDNETSLGLQTAFHHGISSSGMENAFHHGISSSVPNSLPSLVGIDSVGNQSGQSHGHLKFDFQGNPAFHPHSVTECNDGLPNGVPCKPPCTMASNISSTPSERIGNGQLCRVGSNGHSIELNEGVFGSSGNGSCPLPRHQYMWNSLHHPRPPGMMWPNSPSFVNGVCAALPQPQMHGVPSAPSHMLSTVAPINNHHVGSAPAVNHSLWDRQHAYAGESPETSGFLPGSLGSMRIPNSSLHPLDFVPHNILMRVGGNCMDVQIPPKNVGQHSHHQRGLMFPGRNQMIPMMSSFDPPNERGRSRRNESSSNQADSKKQYELDIDRIVRGEDNRTTLMIKNIPNKYTSKMLLATIDERHRGTYDFIYLPIDFKNKCNVGYAFINMTDPSQIIPFYQAFNGKKWEKFNSEKVASLAYARIQGKSALIAHFQNSSLMNEDKRCRPILFHTDGPNAGDQVPFPMGVNVRSRPGKSRSSTTEENHQESPPILENKEEPSNGDSSSGSIKELD
ncbi:protein MEI2-like 4 isoform X2 [Malania oleifera]|uniref:protein MEI2-like 4 isoform X2 n=1 Tax=Malania oleifera TaxID=397392 RepID=UPI0025AE2017|nr:protein MEI2-like 4 isoform X2 [Malania oleifera]XP_057950022.1 protein MEI2-like 4 isoform X2 [Malania oleifera]